MQWLVNYFKNNKILLLFSIIPFGYLVSFFLTVFGGKNISSYFYLLSFFFLVKLSVRKSGFFWAVFLCLYMMGNILFFPGTLAGNAREVVPFILFLATAYNADFLIAEFHRLSHNTLYPFLKVFSYIFLIAFIVTAAFVGKKVYDEEIVREYYDGFVISHHFSYFAILLAFIVLKYNNFRAFFLLSIAAVLVGNRISYLTFVFTFLIYFQNQASIFTKDLFNRSTIYLLSGIAALSLYLVFFTNYITWESIFLFLEDSRNRDFTSGRTLFWANGFYELKKVPFLSFNFFFGLGPSSVEVLSRKLYDTYYWMHNDFMQVYFCYGFFGLSLYLHALYIFVRSVRSSVVVWLIFVTAMFNGFYTYGAIQLFIMIIILSVKTSSKFLNPIKLSIR